MPAPTSNSVPPKSLEVYSPARKQEISMKKPDTSQLLNQFKSQPENPESSFAGSMFAELLVMKNPRG